MPEWLIWIGGVLLFLVLLSLTVGIHEAGHMLVAKKLGLHVPEYSIGFGPRLWRKKTSKTEYNVRAISLGGYVLIEDERYPEKSYERGSLAHIAPWKRQLIYLAGPGINLLVGTVVLMVALLAFPYQVGTNTVEKLQECSVGSCGALEGGLEPGDQIISVDGQKTSNLNDIATAKQGKSSIEVEVIRAGVEQTFTVPLGEDNLMGITVTTEDAWRSPSDAWSFIVLTVQQNLKALANLPDNVEPIWNSLFTGNRPADAPGSVVSVGKTYGDTAIAQSDHWYDKIYTYTVYTALFNVGIGFLNFLPILPLDGGRMFIAFMDSCRKAWSKLRKKVYTPIRKTVYMAMASVSAIAVFGFMGLLILSDFSLIFHGNL